MKVFAGVSINIRGVKYRHFKRERERQTQTVHLCPLLPPSRLILSPLLCHFAALCRNDRNVTFSVRAFSIVTQTLAEENGDQWKNPNHLTNITNQVKPTLKKNSCADVYFKNPVEKISFQYKFFINIYLQR